jgi:Flp pilus assembly protein TadG
MKHIKSERGQSLVELSISILILLVLLAGAVEFGMAFFQFVQLRDAAQEGALYGSLNPPASTGDVNYLAIVSRIRNSSDSPIDLTDTSVVPDANITITVNGAACEGNSLEVRVSYDHQVFMPFMSQIIGSTVPLNATVTDTILSPVCP